MNGANMFHLLAGQSDNEDDNILTPTIIKSLSSILITQIHLSSTHALACAADGIVYSWGDNAV
jgi:alpha-tubulin suppressor-like RCC1 family protein